MITKAVFFSHIVNDTLKHEGGYANHPADKGGETYRGITRKHNSEWEGWRYIDEVKRTGKGLDGLWDWAKEKVSSAKSSVTSAYDSVFSSNKEKYTIPTNTLFPDLENSAKDLYYNKYFVANQFDRISNIEIAKILFDYAVHGGYTHIGLQRLINKHFPGNGKNGGNVAEDNKIGSETIGAVNAIGAALKPYLLQWRQGHLQQIVERDPTQKVFEEGWKKRLASFGPVEFATKNKTYIFIGLGVVVVAIVAYIYFTKSKQPKASNQQPSVEPNLQKEEQVNV
jgi:lysozyme family protein